MQLYEIRVIKDGRTCMLYEAMYFNDEGALRAGIKYAAGLDFEVWRGLERVYGRRASAPIPSPSD